MGYVLQWRNCTYKKEYTVVILFVCWSLWHVGMEGEKETFRKETDTHRVRPSDRDRRLLRKANKGSKVNVRNHMLLPDNLGKKLTNCEYDFMI